ncbi:MAG TPA: nuclear transport factor 2 family protein [Rhodanobacteraceae bacterium]|nr:nuclear transport factor 2 family protein [Rhodanobacteraceae bacterium]
MNRATEQLIERFYRAFQQRDAATMAACYHRRAVFRDPVFELNGANIGAMWTMLCGRAPDLRIEFDGVHAEGDHGRAEWQAWYTFGQTGRPVHNRIRAEFAFADGLIVDHVDRFDFWRWSRQALGLPGLLLGWTPALQAKVRAQAQGRLEQFLATHSG